MECSFAAGGPSLHTPKVPAAGGPPCGGGSKTNKKRRKEKNGQMERKMDKGRRTGRRRKKAKTGEEDSKGASRVGVIYVRRAGNTCRPVYARREGTEATHRKSERRRPNATPPPDSGQQPRSQRGAGGGGEKGDTNFRKINAMTENEKPSGEIRWGINRV